MQTVDHLRGGAVARFGRMIYASGVLVPLLFILLTIWLAPLADYHEMDPDEGGNLMKAMLVNQGHPLYTETWSDQPPLLTLILAQWFRWFGPSLLASRILILLFSATLVWAFYQTVRLDLSEPAALSSVALLVVSGFYIRLSASVMIGLPAVALAMLAIYILLVAERSERRWLTVISGLVFGLSMQIKFFTAILAPVVLLHLCLSISAKERQWPHIKRSIVLCVAWLGAAAVGFAVVGLVSGALDPRSLLAPHVAEQTRQAYESGHNLADLKDRLLAHATYLPLVVVGVLWGVTRRTSTLGLALGWFLIALAALLYQVPLWYHHFLLLMVPLAWLSAFGIDAGLRGFGLSDRRQPGAVSARRGSLIRAAGVLFAGSLVLVSLITRSRSMPAELAAIPFNEGLIARLCPDGRVKPAWVFSDRPIYAFEAGLLIPPSVAVTSQKRLLSGQLTETMLLDVLKNYRPEFVVLERFYPSLSPAFKDALAADYEVLQAYYRQADIRSELLRLKLPDSGEQPGEDSTQASVLLDGWLSLAWNPARINGNVEAGNCLGVAGLSWQPSEARSGRDLAVSLRLTDESGTVVARYDERLGAEFSTIPGHGRMPYFLNLLVPADTPTGEYDLSLIVYDSTTGAPLEASGATPRAGGVLLRRVGVVAPGEASSPQN